MTSVASLPLAFRRSALPILALLLAAACQDLPVSPDEGTEDARRPRSPANDSPVNPFAGTKFFVDPSSNARRQADEWRLSRPADAMEMDKIARNSQAKWFGDWSGDIRAAVDREVGNATAAGAVPVLVAYNIPQRDCGGLSGGGGATYDAYRSWIDGFAKGIAGRKAAVILEPDALAMLDCLPAADQKGRLELLRYAVGSLRRSSGTAVYVDAGHPRWHSADRMAARLRQVDVAAATGFSLNVSNFIRTDANVEYGTEISDLLDGKRFVIDTSRNGVGPSPDGEWCNPEGRALGAGATTATGSARVDAFLWIKRPGESDGACNGAPPAGSWWAEYALGLAQRSSR